MEKLYQDAFDVAKKMSIYRTGASRSQTDLYHLHNGALITYNVDVAPQIMYQNEGFVHYLSKKQVSKNVNYIGRTVSAISLLVHNHYNDKQTNILSSKDRIVEYLKDDMNNARANNIINAVSNIKVG